MADIIGMQPAGRVLPLFKGDYDNDIVYEQTDVVLYNTSSYIAIQDTVGNAPPEPDVNRNEYWQLVAKGMTDISDSTVKFTQAETRADIKSGETSSTLFGKIMKWFSDLKPHCFISPVNNLLATVAGTALDAVQGKVLYDRITQLNSDLSVKILRNDANTFIVRHGKIVIANIKNLPANNYNFDLTVNDLPAAGIISVYAIMYDNDTGHNVLTYFDGNVFVTYDPIIKQFVNDKLYGTIMWTARL